MPHQERNPIDRIRWAISQVPEKMQPYIFAVASAYRPDNATRQITSILESRFGLKFTDTELTRAAQATRTLAMMRRDNFGDYCKLLGELRQENIQAKLWKLGSGQTVVDRQDSHLTPEVIEVLSAVTPTIFVEQGKNFINHSHNFRQTIGTTICVTTGPRDRIVFACRKNRPDGHTRFVENRNPEPTSWVTIGLKLLDDGTYQIRTAYCGEKAPPEPWDKYVRNKSKEWRASKDFWSSHALIWNPELIIDGTRTSNPPPEWRW